jgi:hypothetical protein
VMQPLDASIFKRAPDGLLNAIAPLYGDVISLGDPHGLYRVHGDNMWAQTKIDPTRFLAYIAQGRTEAAWLRQHGEMLGTPLAAGDPLDRSWDFLEWRLIAHKLCPDHSLVANDNVIALLWHACGSVRHYEPRLWRRSVMLAWFSITALSPRRLSKRLIELRFEPTRSRLLERVVRSTKGTTPLASGLGIARRSGTDQWEHITPSTRTGRRANER